MTSSLTMGNSLVTARLQIARMLDIDTAEVLRRAEVKQRALRNPLGRITLDQDNAIWRSLVEVTGDPAIGLKLGSRFQMPGFGLVGYLLMNVDTMFEGFQRFCKYQRLLANAYRFEVDQNESGLAYSFHYEGEWKPERRCTLDFAMAVTYQLTGTLGVSAPDIKQVRFQHDAPEDLTPYQETFADIDLAFGCNETCFLYRPHAVEIPTLGAQPDLLPMFERQAEALLAKYDQDNFSDRVRQSITRAFQGNVPTLETIAQDLHLSARSLQIKLKQEDTSYQAVLDEVRKELAIAYLRNSALSKSEISYLLGFSEVSTFSRKFKQWTGRSPSAFQEQDSKV
ncbi:MAG: AraC family transcriptional regulator [Cyanobacteria bacterium P01_F01_bin.153]